jgi:very-short-patch-repair endonuclease
MDQRIFGLEVDAVWLEERLIVELDGWAFHNNRQSFETDRDRDVDMLVVRFETVRLTWDRMHERPEREAARLRVIVDQRRQEAQLLHWPTLPPSLGRRMR